MALTLRKARLVNEKSQHDMARILDINVGTYRKLEANPDLVRIDQAKKIAEYLNLSVEDIFFASELN